MYITKKQPGAPHTFSLPERSWELGTFRAKQRYSRNGQTCFPFGCNCRARNYNTIGISQPKENWGISSYGDKFAFIEMVQPPRPRIIIGLFMEDGLWKSSREVVEQTLVWQVRLVINLSTEGFLGLHIPISLMVSVDGKQHSIKISRLRSSGAV